MTITIEIVETLTLPLTMIIGEKIMIAMMIVYKSNHHVRHLLAIY